MSRDLVVYVVDNTTNKVMKLFNDKDEDVTMDLFDNGPMSLLCWDSSEEAFEYYRGFPTNCPEEILEIWGNESCVTYYDYCELRALARTPEANLKDWDAMEESGWQTGDPYITHNLMPVFMAKVNMICAAYHKHFIKPGEVYIICAVSY